MFNKNKKITFGKISQNIGQHNTNIEATIGFGKFGKSTVTKPVEIEECEDDIEQKQLKEVMGIAGFGKKAKTFDVEEMMEQVKKTARQITASTSASATVSKGSSDSEDDDEFIGPPIPDQLGVDDNNKSKGEEKEKDSDDSEGEGSDTEGDITKKIPASHEVCMNHGLKAITAISADPSGARLGKRLLIKYLMKVNYDFDN